MNGGGNPVSASGAHGGREHVPVKAAGGPGAPGDPRATVRRDIFIVGNEVDEMGGVTTWQARTARLLAARGHRVRIIGIAPARCPVDLGQSPPFATEILYSVRPPGPWRPRTALDRANVLARLRQARREAGQRQAAARLSEIFRTGGPGSVIIVTQVWAMEWVAMADTSGHLLIGMSHESFDAARRSSRFQRVRTFYRAVDRLLALTREDADLWIGQGLNNVDFMPNPMPVTPSAPSPRTGKVVVGVGRLSHEKGVDLLLDAWAEAAEQAPGWRLRLYGAGEEDEALRSQCTRLGLDATVDFAGPTDDVGAALGQAAVFVLPSRDEGFPLTLLEAMAYGLPCVAFDCAPGVREIVRDGEDGLLARPGNSSELARHLVRLMNDDQTRDRMGDSGFHSVRRFAPETVTDRWEDLFAFLER